MLNTNELSDVGRRVDAAAVGAVVWATVAVGTISGAVDLTIFQLFLVLGPLVVVPLGRPLTADRATAPHAAAVAAAAIAVVGAVVAEPGPLATALTAPWLLTALLLTAAAAIRARRGGDLRIGPAGLQAALAVAAPGWLVVGAVSLTASCAAARPFGISSQLVELGAVHFSYAGFAATTLAWCVLRRARHRRLAAVAAVATVGGAAVVALGHLTVRPLELVGAISMTVGVLLVGVLGWSAAPRRTIARALLGVAAVAVVVPMVLALQYALALTTGGSHPPYETIARVHGTLNAIGFSIGGLLGWRLLERRSRPRRAAVGGGPGTSEATSAAAR